MNEKNQILVVDDELINREFLCNMLQQQYEVLIASSGKEALQIIRGQKEKLSLVMLDLNMSDMNGLEVLSELKADLSIPQIPVIVMTSDKAAEVDSLLAGAVDFIPKPYPMPEVIYARIRRIIELYEGRTIINCTENDRLTGLYNREFFYRYATRIDMRHSDLVMDAIVLDINHFHILNERCGKTYGDQILKNIAKKATETVDPEFGLVCRPEADTFLIYCPHRTDYTAMLEHISTGLTGDKKTDHRVRLRMGVYSEVDKTLEIERRFDRAKLAADTIRGSFAKSIAIYDNALHELEIFEDQLLEDFHTALQEGQFQVYYQPKFDIRPDVPFLGSCEALCRWKHPELGMVSPAVFVPLFERHGLVHELDEFVWEQAAAQLKDWKERLGISVPVSVNVSRVDMYDPELAERFLELLNRYQLTTDDLFLEITESAYTQDSDQIVEMVNRLRRLNFRVEMDDFGSGYSSLNMVSTLPIDALKLDMQFIRGAFEGRKNTKMLEVVLDMAESLDVPTIAEGVETAEQMVTLRDMGCDYVQGYYFSKPVQASEFDQFLIERKQQETSVTDPPEKKKKRRSDLRECGCESITYNSLHDPLTGLFNYSAYELLFRDVDQAHLAIVVAEVDDYLYLRDRFGQVVADNAIKKIADVLKKSFRSVDYICRISKDEFVIIVSRVDSAQQDAIINKLNHANELLQIESEDIPPLSLSMGIAFSDRLNPQGDVFEDADMALHRLKEENRKGLSVF